MNPLKALLELAQQREDLEEQILFTVAKARAEKHSWQSIANVIGGTKQGAQQRYGKAIERDNLLEQGKYECSCGWTLVYPGWESREALEDITEHEQYHEDQNQRDDYGTEPAELGQLENEASKAVDAVPAQEMTEQEYAEKLALAHANADRILAAEAAAKAAKKAGIIKPLRTDAAPADRDADETMDRIESGELDTEGYTIDWSQKDKAGRCVKCSSTHHYDGKGRNLYFWIGPECNPTHRDATQHRPR